MWYCSVFTQYSYYSELFCSGTASRLCNCHYHGWVRYIDTTIIMVWCMPSLLLSIDIQWFCYFIMFYYKLNNVAMVKCCNGEIKIRIGRFFSHKYRICSFALFLNTTFSQQKNRSITFNVWSPTMSTSTKFILTIQATTEIQGFIRGWSIIVMEIMNLI